MKVYDKIISDTMEILSECEIRELTVNPNIEWKCLKGNEYIMDREKAFELGDRNKPSTTYNCLTDNKDLVDSDRIILIGKDLQEIKRDTNFSRISFINVDHIENPNKAYIEVKKLEYERFNIIPEGYMVLSSSIENKENIRVSKKAIKSGLDFSVIGNLFINHYKKLEGVNNVVMIFIVGDYDFIDKLVEKSREVDRITNAFEHVLKNIILDCDVCPLKQICEDVETLREEHFFKDKKIKAINNKL